MASYGYGITDSGELLISWKEAEGTPLRCVEIDVTDGTNTSIIIAGESGARDRRNR